MPAQTAAQMRIASWYPPDGLEPGVANELYRQNSDTRIIGPVHRRCQEKWSRKQWNGSEDWDARN